MCAVPTVGRGQCRVSDPSVGIPALLSSCFLSPSQTVLTHTHRWSCPRKTISLGGENTPFKSNTKAGIGTGEWDASKY